VFDAKASQPDIEIDSNQVFSGVGAIAMNLSTIIVARHCCSGTSASGG